MSQVSHISNANLSAELKRRFPDVPDNVVYAVMEKTSNNREMCIEVLDKEYQTYLKNHGSMLGNNLKDSSTNSPARMPDGRLIPVPPPRIPRDGLRHQGSAGNMSRSSSSSSHNSVSAVEGCGGSSDGNRSVQNNFSPQVAEHQQQAVGSGGPAFFQTQGSPYSSFRGQKGEQKYQNDNRNFSSGSSQVPRSILSQSSESDESPPNTQNAASDYSGISAANNNNSIQQSSSQNISHLQSSDQPQAYTRQGVPLPTRYVPFQYPRDEFGNDRPQNFPQEFLQTGQQNSPVAGGFRYHSRSSEPSVDVSGIHNPLQPTCGERFKSSVSFDAGNAGVPYGSPGAHIPAMNNPRAMHDAMRGAPYWSTSPRFPQYRPVTPPDRPGYCPRPPGVSSPSGYAMLPMYRHELSAGYLPAETIPRDMNSGQWSAGSQYTHSRSPSQSSDGSGQELGFVKAFMQKQNFQLETLAYYHTNRSKQLESLRQEISDLESRVRQVRREKNETFPTSDDLQNIQDENRNLLIDVERLTREIDLADNGQALLGVLDSRNSSGNSVGFYANIQTGQTGSLQSRSVVPPPRTSRGSSDSTPPPRPAVPPSPVLRPQRPAPPPPIVPPSRLARETGGGEFLNSMEEEPPWPCSACTFLNHPALKQCECCDYPKTIAGGELQDKSHL